MDSEQADRYTFLDRFPPSIASSIREEMTAGSEPVEDEGEQDDVVAEGSGTVHDDSNDPVSVSGDGDEAEDEDAEPQEETATPEDTPPVSEKKKTFSFWKDGKEITDLSSITAEELLSGEVRYRALHKDQAADLPKLVRLAAAGHLNQQRMAVLQVQRDQTQERVDQLSQELEEKNDIVERVVTAMQDRSGQALRELQQEFLKTQKEELEEPKSAGPDPEEIHKTGEQVLTQVVTPRIQELASSYSDDPRATQLLQEGLMETFQALVNQEGKFLTQQRFVEILMTDLPMALEATSDQIDEAIAELTKPEKVEEPPKITRAEAKRIAELEAQVKNLTLAIEKDTKRKAGKGIDPARSLTPSDTPKFKSMAEVKEWIRNR